MNRLTKSFRFAAVLGIVGLGSLFSTVAVAGICDAVIGWGSYALRTGFPSYVLAHGPFTCNALAIGGGAAQIPPNAFGKGYSDVGDASGAFLFGSYTTVSGGQVVLRGIALQASSEMGHNHLFLNSGPWPQTGGSSGDSLWGGIGMLVGPASSFARVTFSGRVDGSLAGDSSLTYGLAIATSASSYSLIVDQTDTSTERWSAFGNGIVDVPLGTTRHSSALYDTFRIALTLPTNTPIGIQSFLSATSQEGAVANLFHTAGIDEIVVPVGFTFSSNGSPLAFDGTGYSYPLAAVPEPSTMLMLATGLAMIGVAAGRKLRTHSKLAQPSIEPEG